VAAMAPAVSGGARAPDVQRLGLLAAALRDCHETPEETPRVYEVPPRGRTYEAILGVAAGSQGDVYSVSFSSSTSLESNYEIIDVAHAEVTPAPSELDGEMYNAE
jgi:hypothetical protein